VSKSVHQTYWVSEEPRDQIKQARPDAKVWSYPFASFLIHMRTDQAPFKDKRVRQALSMSINRKMIRDGVSKGEGEDDQLFSPANGPQWGFRKPKDLGSAAKNWEFNLQTAKQLLSAAGITGPLEFPFSHGDASALGAAIADTATLVQAQWRQNGIANVQDNVLTGAVWFSTTLVGNYEGMGIASGLQFNVLGTQLKNYLWSPPEGVKSPTRNLSYINNSALNTLMDKQLTQLNFNDRKQTFKGAEDILADEMYWIPFSTGSRTYFTDPSLRNNIVPLFAYSGSTHYLKYQWFQKA
jgi:peptide/nickel transport system substrate-binding protein